MNRSIVLALLGGLSVCCASVPMASADADRSAKKFAAAPGQANLYVYRNETFGRAIRMGVQLDGNVLGDTAAMTYLYTPIAPGSHTLISKTENDSELIIDAKPGSNYFVWQEVKMGVWAARSLLHQVDDKEGRDGVNECALVKTNLSRLAGCSRDTDCKGNRICSAGACVDSPAVLPAN